MFAFFGIYPSAHDGEESLGSMFDNFSHYPTLFRILLLSHTHILSILETIYANKINIGEIRPSVSLYLSLVLSGENVLGIIPISHLFS